MELNTPAFPFEHGYSPDATNVRETGMSLRDWFAGQALIANILSSDVQYKNDGTSDAVPSIDDYAIDAYRIADRMLKVRQRKDPMRED